MSSSFLTLDRPRVGDPTPIGLVVADPLGDLARRCRSSAPGHRMGKAPIARIRVDRLRPVTVVDLVGAVLTVRTDDRATHRLFHHDADRLAAELARTAPWSWDGSGTLALVDDDLVRVLAVDDADDPVEPLCSL